MPAFPTGIVDRNPEDVIIALEPRRPTPWDRGRFLARPILAAAVTCSLCYIQVRAMKNQFAGGYRPFQHEPTRVPFSWDMFAVKIARCNIAWSPPLKVRAEENKTITTLADLSPTIEWNPVYNTIEDYKRFARYMCNVAGADSKESQSAALVCFDPAAQRTLHYVRCR